MSTARPRGNRHKAYEHLRSGIIRLDFPPGTTLSENEHSAALGMSRTPVREALMLLAEEGLVDVVPQVGTFVTRVDPARVAEAQFLREAVELASLRTLATPLDADLLGRLRENLVEQEGAGDDVARFFELDDAFHEGLMALAGHAATWAIVAAAKGHLDRARRLGVEDPGAIRARIAEHRAVLDAVVAGDLELGVDKLRHHLRVVFEDIRTIERESPQLFLTDPEARPVRRSVLVWE